jgi:hypothetical protein
LLDQFAGRGRGPVDVGGIVGGLDDDLAPTDATVGVELVDAGLEARLVEAVERGRRRGERRQLPDLDLVGADAGRITVGTAPGAVRPGATPRCGAAVVVVTAGGCNERHDHEQEDPQAADAPLRHSLHGTPSCHGRMTCFAASNYVTFIRYKS